MAKSRPSVRKETAGIMRTIFSGQPETMYCDNHISTRRYTWWSFLPISIIFQFRKLSNCYFLASAAIMLIPEISPLSPMSAIGPLIFVVAASELREFLEELGAAKRDKKANLAIVDKVSDRVATQTLHPGDIVIVRKDEGIPADLVLFLSSSADGTAFVETANLDGETNLKVKRCPVMTLGMTVNDIYGYKLSCEPPNADMYVFKGVVETDSISESLNLSHLLLRGCTLRNTEWVAGVVVYSGHDTKMLLNARSGLTPSKVTSIDTQMNRNVISLFIIQMILCIISSAIGISYAYYWYLAPLDSITWISLFLTYFILLNTLIPASLWVCVEILKYIQALFIEADPSVSIKCNSKNVHEELGQITHVFTDKTGTLTVNKMKFVGCSVRGTLYYDSTGAQSDTPPLLAFSGVLPPSNSLVERLRLAASVPRSSESDLLRCLALCHTCERLCDSESGAFTNQSSSPDEAALVSLSAECGWMFTARPDPNRIVLTNSSMAYTLLHHVAFTSERRMMTVVVREEASGEILALCKGADSSVVPRCIDGGWVGRSVSTFSAHGFRTLCVAQKAIAPSEWDAISAELNQQIDVSERIESGMTLLGCTAVEDRLQEGVVETLTALKDAGIMVCMITGDKRETAINIARSCGLISTKRSVYTMLSHGHMYGGGQFVPLRNLEALARNEENTGNNQFARDVWQLATEPMGMADRPDGPTDTPDEPPSMGPPLDRQTTHPSALLSGKFSLVIDGVALSSIVASATSTQQLVDVLSFDQCEAVVFCRVSPKQKGQVVALVQDSLASSQHPTSALAIGDGANDINMINMANVGVGISGNEGAQAANSADYAIGEFQDLNRLLFFHGRLNYKRTSVFVNIFMYKNFLFTLCQFWFATVSLFSGQTVFDDAYVLVYNSVFCLLPLFLTGLLDKDLKSSTPLLPKIYAAAERFTEWSMLKWCLIGTLQSLAVFYICWLAWAWTNTAIDQSGGKNASMWMASLVSYTAQIIIVSFVNMWVTTDWTPLFLWSILVFNFGLYFAFVFVYNLITFGSSDYVSGVATGTLGNLQFWFITGLITAISMGPLIAFTKLMEHVRPRAWLSIVDILRVQATKNIEITV